MTTAQIKHIIVNILKDKIDTLTRLNNCRYFVFDKSELKFCHNDGWLYYFNTNDDVVECYPVKKVLNGGQVVDGNHYEFAYDKNDIMICQYYDFAEIIAFVPEVGK